MIKDTKSSKDNSGISCRPKILSVDLKVVAICNGLILNFVKFN